MLASDRCYEDESVSDDADLYVSYVHVSLGCMNFWRRGVIIEMYPNNLLLVL